MEKIGVGGRSYFTLIGPCTALENPRLDDGCPGSPT